MKLFRKLSTALPVGIFCILSQTALFAPPARANDTLEVLELKVSRLGDTNLSCGALSQEALLMHDIVEVTQDIQDDSRMKSHGINAAVGVGGFLIGTVTGGIGIAAAGFLLDQSTKDNAESADGVQDIAQQRRSFMVGIFESKGCFGPIEHVMRDRADDNEDIKVASVEPAVGGDDTEPQKPRYNQ